MNSRRSRQAKIDALREAMDVVPADAPKPDRGAVRVSAPTDIPDDYRLDATGIDADVPEAPRVGRSPGKVSRLPGVIVRVSPSGDRVIGYRPADKPLGRSLAQDPLAIELKAAEDAYLGGILDAYRAGSEAAGVIDRQHVAAGKESGKARGSRAAEILRIATARRDAGKWNASSAAALARKLNLTASYVRKVISRAK